MTVINMPRSKVRFRTAVRVLNLKKLLYKIRFLFISKKEKTIAAASAAMHNKNVTGSLLSFCGKTASAIIINNETDAIITIGKELTKSKYVITFMPVINFFKPVN
jgi:hypothetical protein